MLLNRAAELFSVTNKIYLLHNQFLILLSCICSRLCRRAHKAVGGQDQLYVEIKA